MEDKSTPTNIPTTIAATVLTTAINDKKLPLDGEIMKNNKRGSFTLIKTAMLMMRRRPDGKSKPVRVEVASKVMLTKLVGSVDSMRPLRLQDNQSPPPSALSASPTYQQSDDVSPPLPSPHRTSSASEDNMSQYCSATNLHELDKGGESRLASSTNLEELDKKGEESRFASSTNLEELDKKEGESHFASSTNLQKRRYASAGNLQELDNKGGLNRYASAMNLQALYKEGESDDDDDSDDGINANGGDEMIDAKAEAFIAQFYKQMKLQHLKAVERHNKMMARRMH